MCSLLDLTSKNIMKKFEELYDFINRAINNRNYAGNTGISLKTALRLFEKEINDEEKNSIDKFHKNIEQIYHSVCSKNKNFSAGSLATYKSRVIKVVTDYEKYGADPTKMSSWTKKAVSHSKRGINKPNDLREKNHISLENNVGQSFIFNDSGTGWNLIIKSVKPISSEIKKILVDVSDSLKNINENKE